MNLIIVINIVLLVIVVIFLGCVAGYYCRKTPGEYAGEVSDDIIKVSTTTPAGLAPTLSQWTKLHDINEVSEGPTKVDMSEGPTESEVRSPNSEGLYEEEAKDDTSLTFLVYISNLNTVYVFNIYVWLVLKNL